MIDINDFVEVSIDLTKAKNQLIFVTFQFNPKSLNQQLELPNWTPGSYTIRDHSQYLYDLEVFSEGEFIKPKRKTTNNWEINLNNLKPIFITYKVIANDLTVRTSYIDSNFASICLSSIILCVREKRNIKHKLFIKVPDKWKYFIPLLNNKGIYANNYDDLIDAPLHAGNLKVEKIKVLNYKHDIILLDSPIQNWNKFIYNDIIKVLETTCSIVNEEPPSKNNYQLVILLLKNKYGGLEHNNSCVIQYCWKKLISKDGYRKFLQLIGHEYFHQWNVRRLRPIEHKIYNYNKPILTENLWFAEGLTSYFELFIPYKAGITDFPSLLIDLSRLINKYLNTEGRYKQSLSESSQEAWIKLYKPNQYSHNNQISYYLLGALTCLCLDISLREEKSSLSSIFRILWNDKSLIQRGYERQDIIKVISSVSVDISLNLNKWLDHPGSLKIEDYLKKLGINLKFRVITNKFSGLYIVSKQNSLNVDRVANNSSAMRSGIIPGDIIIAINNYIINNHNDIEDIIENSESCKITFNRNGRLMETILLRDEENLLEYYLEDEDKATDSQLNLREEWLNIN